MALTLIFPNPFRRSEMQVNAAQLMDHTFWIPEERARVQVIALVETVVKSVLNEIQFNLYLYQNIERSIEMLVRAPSLVEGEDLVSSNKVNRIGEETVDVVNSSLTEWGRLYSRSVPTAPIRYIENPYKSPSAKTLAALETQIGTRISEREASAKVLSKVKELVLAKIKELKEQDYLSKLMLQIIKYRSIHFELDELGETSLDEVLKAAALSVDSINASLPILASYIPDSPTSAFPALTVEIPPPPLII